MDSADKLERDLPRLAGRVLTDRVRGLIVRLHQEFV